jgi:hypothetical protein
MVETINSFKVNLIGIAAWKFVPSEPRHNTFHNSLSVCGDSEGIKVNYLGLKNTYKANWIIQILPDTVLKRIPYMSPIHYLRVRKSLNVNFDSKSVIYVFEGTLSWLILLSLVSKFVPNSVLVCNLFSSSKYSKVFFSGRKMRRTYRVFFLIVRRMKNLYVTFDTALMVDKVNTALGVKLIGSVFPLPSALPYLQEKKYDPTGHHRVLVNLRDFEISGLHKLLNNSCLDCTFVFPRGPMASTPLSIEFGTYNNVEFDESNVAVEDYLEYIDQFDYMIFLYRPSIDSTGRLLDAIVRRIPVCVPIQSTEWCNIAREWGELHQYDWLSIDEKGENFNHPNFSFPTSVKLPPFTPKGGIENLSSFASDLKIVKFKDNFILKFLSISLVTFHWVFAIFCNYFLAITSRVGLVFAKLK